MILKTRETIADDVSAIAPVIDLPVKAVHSAFDRLVRLHRAKLVGMFETYCDESGGADHGFIAVAGWLASADRWRKFETDWKALLERYEVPYLHMKDVAHFQGPYKKWFAARDEREKFLAQAVEIIQQTVEFGFLSVVWYDAFRKVNERFYLDKHQHSPYAIAGRFCIARANQWMRRQGYSVRDVAYIFEDGGPDVGGLTDLAKRSGVQIPTFHPSRDTELQSGMVPLQAADFLAYEIRKGVRDHRDKFTKPEEFRKSFQAFFSCDVEQGNYEESELLDLCDDAKIPIRDFGVSA